MRFKESRREAQERVVEEIKRTPYEDPSVKEEQERRQERFRVEQAKISHIAFGIITRARGFSLEFDGRCSDGRVVFDDVYRAIRIKAVGRLGLQTIMIRLSNIHYHTAYLAGSGAHILVLQLR
jgi:hypothetical protein